ncbi:MAG: hypothetical protein JWM19_802 [Actinomycetia bacterium]|nr:hypothetical protein [Actinomycetes bacterium]
MAFQEDAMGTYEEGAPVPVVDISKLLGRGKPPADMLSAEPPSAREQPSIPVLEGIVVHRPEAAQAEAQQSLADLEWTRQQSPVDLNVLRGRILRNIEDGVVDPADPSRQIFTDNEGNIMLGDQRNPATAHRQSEIPQSVFYAPDLNKIAQAARENQRRGEVDPADPTRQMFTNKDGDILMGDQVDPQNAERYSRITQETFFAADSPRLALERRIVGDKMPSNTFQASDGTTTGWVYSVTNEFSDKYTLFAWYDMATATYKVSLVEPDLRGKVGVEDCHLYGDGTICLKREGGHGYRNLEDAYSRSVLWTRGASCYRRGYGFQFNLGQEG